MLEAEKARKQKTFDAVARHLMAQASVAYNANTEQCMYRCPDGRKCAIGSLIPDESFNPDWENISIKASKAMQKVLGGLGFSTNACFLYDLQVAHDDARWVSDQGPETVREAFERNLTALASAHNLSADVFGSIRKPEPRKEPASRKGQQPIVEGTKRHMAQLYRKAAEFFDTHKWGKGLMYSKEGDSYCAIGGFQTVAAGAPYHNTPKAAELRAVGYEDILSSAITGGPIGMMRYNDSTAKTKEDVQRFLRGVAYMLDHGGRLPPWAKAIQDRRTDSMLAPMGGSNV